ncbi:MAG: diguanylate cyclase [Syntrophobacterales bacterium]|nr:MAG: diguanylate cyclase [Syntrophobacterales bacterium]
MEKSKKGEKAKILIIDDIPDTVDIVKKLFKSEGHAVFTASTGEEGVRRATQIKPDVILLDINLPGIDGNMALRKIKRETPGQSVVMLTAYATLDNAIQALKEGASDFVKKPFEMDHLVHIVNRCIEKTRIVREKERLEEEVRRLSITDDLTGLYNHRYFYKKLEEETIRAQRQNIPLSLMMFDVDNFKKYNDTRGHIEGDKVLETIGKIVDQCIRQKVDSGYRYGGDEFAVILIGVEADRASEIAERIRGLVEKAKLGNVTISIGLAEYNSDSDIKHFVKSVDDAMYMAKSQGGNRMRIYTLAGMK